MKTKWIISVVAVVALIGVAVYFGNTKLQKGTFSMLPLPATPTNPSWRILPGSRSIGSIGDGTQSVGIFDFYNNVDRPISIVQLNVVCDGTIADRTTGNTMSVTPPVYVAGSNIGSDGVPVPLPASYPPITTTGRNGGCASYRGSSGMVSGNRTVVFSTPAAVSARGYQDFAVNYDTMYHTYNAATGTIENHPGHFPRGSTFQVHAFATWQYVGETARHTTPFVAGPLLTY